MIRLLLAIAVAMIITGCATTHKVPFVLHDNRILVDVKVNGGGPYKFLFDTGGARSNSLSPQAAKELGLTLTPAGEASGAGSAKQPMWSTRVSSYAVGPLTARDQEMIVIDMTTIQKAFAFPRLDGVIGFDVLKTAITCIDFEKLNLIFKEAGGDCFTEREKIILSLRIENQSPIIQGSVNGIATEFFVDTGDRSAFSIFKKFGQRSGLDALFLDKPEVTTGYGIGGPIPAKLATVESLKLGTQIELLNVLARRPLTTGGFFAKSKLGGSVGNEVLRRFNVVLDYGKNEIRLSRNKHFDEPYRFIPPLDPSRAP